MNDYLKCLIRHAGLSQIFHENLRIATVAQLGNALFPDLAYTLTSQPELIADFLQTFLVTANAETLANNGNLTLFQHLVQHGIQLKCHRLVVNLTVGATVIATRHHIEHTVVLTVLEWGVDAHVVTVSHETLSNLLLVEFGCLRKLRH